MNMIILVALGSLLTLSITGQAGQSIHIGGVNITGSNGLSIVNGKVISGGAQDAVQGSGVMQRESRSLEPFTQVRVHIAANVNITKGTDAECVIEGDANIVPLITTRVQDGVLTIANSKNFSSSRQISVQITTPELSKVVMDGSGDVTINKAQEPALELVISGSGNIRGDGMVDVLKVNVSGSGDMNLFGLRARSAEAVLDGAGTIQVFASETFSGEIGGSGDILVHGHPRITHSVINGAGDITAE